MITDNYFQLNHLISKFEVNIFFKDIFNQKIKILIGR